MYQWSSPEAFWTHKCKRWKSNPQTLCKYGHSRCLHIFSWIIHQLQWSVTFLNYNGPLHFWIRMARYIFELQWPGSFLNYNGPVYFSITMARYIFYYNGLLLFLNYNGPGYFWITVARYIFELQWPGIFFNYNGLLHFWITMIRYIFKSSEISSLSDYEASATCFF